MEPLPRTYSELSPSGARLRSGSGTLMRPNTVRSATSRHRRGSRSRSSTFVYDDTKTPPHFSDDDWLRSVASDPKLMIKPEPWTPPLSPSIDIPKAYASLPPSPTILASYTSVGERHTAQGPSPPPFSLWEYLNEELLAADFDSHQELKWERVNNFLNIPFGVEKILSFGFLLCFDTFLYMFTILPIRAFVASYRTIFNTISKSRPPVPPAHKADILRLLLLVLSVAILSPLTDASKIYHSIRGQDTIKLYVIFNALEIADRLLTSIGQDILDCMFSRSTLLLLTNHSAPSRNTLKPLIFFALSTLYTVSHALVLIYQLTALNVAINAYDNALLTLIISNQFVEIKGSVFKKFEKDNLFQITCADIVERFQLALMLVSIALRNLIELSSAELDLSSDGAYVLPVAFKAFRFVSGRHILGAILTPVLSVLASELVVDWLKHAFITKFNHIRPSVYERYIDILCRDLTTGSWYGKRRNVRKHTYVDQSPVVARRLGFAALPLAVLAIIIGGQSITLLISTHFPDSPWATSLFHLGSFSAVDWIQTAKWTALAVLIWFCAVMVKLIMGINLLAFASRRRSGMDDRMREDEDVNQFTRPPIGEGTDERTYNKQLKTLLTRTEDSAAPTAEIGEIKSEASIASPVANSGLNNRKKLALEDLTRFTMVKRIW